MRIPLKVVWVVLAALAPAGCSGGGQDRDVLWQTSTITALLEGAYDGEVTVGELKHRGDIGLGTFHALDGEMVVLDGTVYQVAADGRARVAPDDLATPFAAVTFFEADLAVNLESVASLDDLAAALDRCLPTPNGMYAVRITGEFAYLKVRSVPRQSKPYPRLAKVVAQQPVFEHRDIRGTLVGLRLPAYVAGVNVPGYHLHFISEDRSVGGHVLACSVARARAEIDETFELHLVLPRGEAFGRADLGGSREEELHKVEK